MMNVAVIGLGFGDEGKGCTVDHICATSELGKSAVVRYSGGHQAGHNVINDGVQHVFSSFGAGSIQGCVTYWERQCMIDPIAIRNEYNILVSKGVYPVLYIDNASPVTTPLERIVNRADMTTRSHGTCGNGIRATQVREEAYYSITAKDIMYTDILRHRYKSAEHLFYKMILSADIEDEFFDACQWLVECPDVYIMDLYNVDKRADMCVYESSQGLLLDKDIGFFPNVTPSNVGLTYFNENGIDITTCYYVTRAYQTRHGNGYMSDRGDIEIGCSEIDTNPTNEFQGEFRTSMLDLDLLYYGLSKDGKHHNSVLVITCLEHISEYKFYANDEVHDFSDDVVTFCETICLYLGFTKYITCTDHKFSKVQHL